MPECEETQTRHIPAGLSGVVSLDLRCFGDAEFGPAKALPIGDRSEGAVTGARRVKYEFLQLLRRICGPAEGLRRSQA